MIKIIIERSQDCMQVVWVYMDSHRDVAIHKAYKDLWEKANLLHLRWRLDDFDILEFDGLGSLNEFLLSELTIDKCKTKN